MIKLKPLIQQDWHSYQQNYTDPRTIKKHRKHWDAISEKERLEWVKQHNARDSNIVHITFLTPAQMKKYKVKPWPYRKW